jgi:hypothetical protein
LSNARGLNCIYQILVTANDVVITIYVAQLPFCLITSSNKNIWRGLRKYNKSQSVIYFLFNILCIDVVSVVHIWPQFLFYRMYTQQIIILSKHYFCVILFKQAWGIPTILSQMCVFASNIILFLAMDFCFVRCNLLDIQWILKRRFLCCRA